MLAFSRCLLSHGLLFKKSCSRPLAFLLTHLFKSGRPLLAHSERRWPVWREHTQNPEPPAVTAETPLLGLSLHYLGEPLIQAQRDLGIWFMGEHRHVPYFKEDRSRESFKTYYVNFLTGTTNLSNKQKQREWFDEAPRIHHPSSTGINLLSILFHLFISFIFAEDW